MLLIRRIEERVAESYGEQKIGGFTHLYIGQEAVGVGALSVLNADDYVISTYRDHGHFLARGGDPKKFMAELFGRATGICKGKGGSMHLADSEHYFYGGTGIVGGSIPIASGLGLACKYREDDRVVMCFFGDGATNQGVWHEGLNFAKLWDLPVVFICENNFYGIGTGVHQSSSLSEVYKKAQGYGMPGYRVNGMDVHQGYIQFQIDPNHADAGEYVGPAADQRRTLDRPGLAQARPPAAPREAADGGGRDQRRPAQGARPRDRGALRGGSPLRRGEPRARPLEPDRGRLRRALPE